MPRPHRTEFPGALHHVTGKAPSGRVLFRDDLDRQRYLQLLAREIRERRWSVLTYCQLTNHLHILVRTPEPDLGLGLKRAHEDFARHFNRRHAEGGHLFGGRFHNRVVSTDRHVLGCLRYIARNPVEAGICRQPRDWPWSGHRALAGLAEPPVFLDIGAALAFLGADGGDARVNYLQLVAKSNEALLADLERTGSDQWLTHAVDDFFASVDEIAAFMGVSLATAYRRLAAARENQGSDPSVSRENEGSDPSFSVLAEG